MDMKVDFATVPLDSVNGEKMLQKSEDGGLPKKKKHGMSMLVAVLFVAGENAGCALLALPHAIKSTGWLGVALIVMCGINAAYAGVNIAKCWLILEERYPKYRENCRYPYAAIAQVAYGRYMRIAVSFCLHVTLIGSCVVVLLLCAEMVAPLVSHIHKVCPCAMVLALAIILCPLMWLETPSEFWPAAALALGTTSIAVLLIVYDTLAEFSKPDHVPAKLPSVNLKEFFLAFGTIMFAYGGTAAFPTFQNDMRNKKKFPISVYIGFIILLILYVPTAISGYITYGDAVFPNVVMNMKNRTLSTTVEFLMAGHLFFAFLLLINAPVQEVEAWLKLPKGLNVKRIITRTLILLLILFIGASVPKFEKVLNLIGGSTVALLSFVFPPLFYMKLCPSHNPEWKHREPSLFHKLWMWQTVILGLLGGIVCTYSAFSEIFGESGFKQPCYLDLYQSCPA